MRLAGQWTAAVNVKPSAGRVTCSSYTDTAGRMRVFEVATDPHQRSEYGTEDGQLYVKVEVGPDGGGNEVAAVTVSMSDRGSLFSGYETSEPSASDTKTRARYSLGADKKTVRMSGYVVAGVESDYSRYADTGWMTLTVAIRCPS